MAYVRSSQRRVLTLIVGLAVMAVAVPAGAENQRTFTDPAETAAGFDIVKVVVSWVPSTSLTVNLTFDNVTDGAFPSDGWVEMALDTDLDDQADHLVEVGYVWSGELRVVICDRETQTSFSCSTQPDVSSPGVEFEWVNDSTLRVEIGDVPSIVFGEQIALRTAAVRADVWDIAPGFGWWLIYDLAADTTPPVVEVRFEILGTSPTSLDGATIETLPTWALIVNDDLDPQPALTCDPPPGSFFPIGETTVTCTATDASGNTSEPASFIIEVFAPSEMLGWTVEAVAESGVRGAAGLTAMLARAADHLDRGRLEAACGTTGAFLAASEHIEGIPDWITSTVDHVYQITECG